MDKIIKYTDRFGQSEDMKLEKAQADKKHSDMMIEGLSAKNRKWFESIDKTDIHHSAYPHTEKMMLISKIYNNNMINAFLFIFKWGFAAGQRKGKREVARHDRA